MLNRRKVLSQKKEVPGLFNRHDQKVKKKSLNRAVVVAQLVEWSLCVLEVPGSNPAIGKMYTFNS